MFDRKETASFRRATYNVTPINVVRPVNWLAVIYEPVERDGLSHQAVALALALELDRHRRPLALNL